MKPLLEFVFPGEPWACPRPRVGKYGVYNVKEYSNYKEALAGALRAAYPELVLDPPSTRTPKERRDFIKKLPYYSLSVQVFKDKVQFTLNEIEERRAKGLKGDLSNYVKTVEDALQDSGILFNDNRIIRYEEPFGVWGSNTPRVEFNLRTKENLRR